MTGLAVRMVSIRWLKPALTGIVALALFGAVLTWAGLPAPEHRLPFALSALVLIAVLAGIGWASWQLLFRPVPEDAAHGEAELSVISLSPGIRRAMAWLAVCGGINIVVGGFWDEVWRRRYDIPFKVELWRPHLLMYVGLGMVLAMAGVALWYLLRHSQGAWPQRFRGHPVLGMLVLTGGFLAYVLPADPVWRAVYGDSITSWSMPHLLLATSFVLVMLVAAALYLSTVHVHRWTTLASARFPELFLITVSAFMLLIVLQVTIVEWDTGAAATMDFRPDWLLPAVLLLAATFVGTFVLRATRLIGSATAAGLAAVGIRYGLIQLFDFHALSGDPWVVILPPLLALDIWYFLELIEVRRPARAEAAALAALLTMVVAGFPLINALFVYPEVTINNVPLMALAGFAGAWAGATLGTKTGEYVATQNKQLAGLNHMARTVSVIPAGGLAVIVAFIVMMILTAHPPA